MEGFAFYMPVEVESGRHSIYVFSLEKHVERCLKWRVRPFVEAIPKQLGVERAVMCQPPFGGSGITAQPRLLPVVVSTSAPSEIIEECVHVPDDSCLERDERHHRSHVPFFSGLVLKSGETTR
jgi:hypothetical protein